MQRSHRRACVALATAEQGHEPTQYWRGRLERLETSLVAGVCECDAARVAVPLAHLGDADRALAALERGAEVTSDVVLYAGVHPAFAALRTTPRFRYLIRRLGLPTT